MKRTSLDAYQKLEASGKAGIDRAKILKFVIDNDRLEGWTRQELSKALRMGINVICGRVNELDSILDASIKRVCTITGSKVERIRPA